MPAAVVRGTKRALQGQPRQKAPDVVARNDDGFRGSRQEFEPQSVVEVFFHGADRLDVDEQLARNMKEVARIHLRGNPDQGLI